MDVRLSAHGAYPQYPVVWILQYRRRMLRGAIKLFVEDHLPQIQHSHPDVTIQHWSVQVDHLHVMLVIPPTYAVSSIVGKMKAEYESATSSWVPRAEADLLGGGAVVSWVLFFDRWIEWGDDPSICGPSRTSGQRAAEFEF